MIDLGLYRDKYLLHWHLVERLARTEQLLIGGETGYCSRDSPSKTMGTVTYPSIFRDRLARS